MPTISPGVKVLVLDGMEDDVAVGVEVRLDVRLDVADCVGL